MRRNLASLAIGRRVGILIMLGATGGCREPEPQPPVTRAEFAIGINPAELSYFGTEVPFIDVFKLAGPWVTQCAAETDPACRPDPAARPGASTWDTREQDKLDLDSEGYPRRLPGPADRAANGTAYSSVATLVPTGLTPTQPFGRFVVLYDGDGVIEYGRGALRNPLLSRAGHDVIDVRADGEQTWFQLAIRSTDPKANGAYIRNIRVLTGGGICEGNRFVYCRDDGTDGDCGNGSRCLAFSGASLPIDFDPRFLGNLRRFACLRFMGWQNTNNSLTEDWSHRTWPDAAFFTAQQGDGAPIEAMTNLGNRLGTSIWVNMPTRANDDYVRRFAALVKDRLDAGRRVYVEYSNEVWNDAFATARWVQAQAEARWPGVKETPFDKRLQWFGMRTAQICDIWEQVWGVDAGRVVCVMAAQAANPWTAAQALDCPLWAEQGGGPCYQHHVDALAIAPYFGFYIAAPDHAEILHRWTESPDGGLNALFDEIFQGGQFPDSPEGGALRQAREFMLRSADEARKRGLRLIGYEGGQHLAAVGPVSQDRAVTELLLAANRDSRMGMAYEAHLADWREAGGDLYNLWNSVSPYSAWGGWGLLEFRDQGRAAKYDSVVRIIDHSNRESDAQR